MRLDRNINHDGRGKYALLKLRRSPTPISEECMKAADLLKANGLLDFGDSQDTDFFVIRLKDKYAAPALAAYAFAAMDDDAEYGHEVLRLAKDAQIHPLKRKPD